MKIVILAAVAVTFCFASDVAPVDSPIDLKRPANVRLWKVSLVSLAAANLLDTTSSWGKCEASPFLAGSTGRFDGRSMLVKSALLGGLVAVEHITGHRNPKLYRFFAIANFSVSAGLTGVAMRNYGIPAPSGSTNCLVR
jgi:hypothetical protein